MVDPKTINWKAIASGKREPPFSSVSFWPWNSMGMMKFEMPNDYGIYLHDTPLKEKFAGDRWISNGCVRLEDYRFAGWGVRQDARSQTSSRSSASTCPDRSRSTSPI